jgi:hypothetical protein
VCLQADKCEQQQQQLIIIIIIVIIIIKGTMRECGNRVLRRISGPKSGEVTGGWERLNLYASPIIIRVIKPKRMKWAGHVARMGEINTYKIFSGKPESKRPLERRRRWEESIRMDATDIGWEGVDWFHLAQDRDLWRAVGTR